MRKNGGDPSGKTRHDNASIITNQKSRGSAFCPSKSSPSPSELQSPPTNRYPANVQSCARNAYEPCERGHRLCVAAHRGSCQIRESDQTMTGASPCEPADAPPRGVTSKCLSREVPVVPAIARVRPLAGLRNGTGRVPNQPAQLGCSAAYVMSASQLVLPAKSFTWCREAVQSRGPRKDKKCSRTSPGDREHPSGSSRFPAGLAV